VPLPAKALDINGFQRLMMLFARLIRRAPFAAAAVRFMTVYNPMDRSFSRYSPSATKERQHLLFRPLLVPVDVTATAYTTLLERTEQHGATLSD